MNTKDLFSTEAPRTYSSYGTKPYTPRLPQSSQRARGTPRIPLPNSMRSKPSTANSVSLFGTLGGTMTTTLGLRDAAMSPAVVPYARASGARDLMLIDDESKSVDSARVRYATFVADMWASADSFQSPTLFAEHLLHTATSRETTTHAMAVGAATWALDVIAAQPGNDALRTIRNLLLPALYINYDEEQPRYIGSVVQSMLQETPSPVVFQNAFLSHNLFAEDYLTRESEAEASKKVQSKLEKLGLSRKQAVQNLTDQLSELRKTMAFNAWKARMRFKRFDRISRENRMLRAQEAARGLLLQSTFSSWKSTTERTRSVFLSERLHNAASQLENAKNQFQLQCFRSDKHLFTVEELRSDLQGLRKEYEQSTLEKREVEKRLREHDVEASKNLNHHVNIVLRELGAWRRFARRCVEGLSVHDEIVKALEEQQRGTSGFLSASDDEPQQNLAGTVTKGKEAAKEAAGASETPDMNGNSEAILLAWVQTVLNTAPVTPTISTVTNFSTDFQSGEVMLLVLHSVFPNDVPLTPLQEGSVVKRLERLVGSFVKCGVAIVPRPTDFADCNSDILFVVLAELFGRNLQLQSLRKAKELVEGSYTGLEDPITSQIEYSIDMLPSIIDGAQEEIATLIQQEATMRRQGGTLLKWQEIVGRDAAFATRERMSGNPVRAIGRSNVEKYWKFKVGRYADLEPKYRIKDEGWKDHLVGSVRRVLQKHVHTTSRLFFRFSWSSSSMSEVHFWRLATAYKLGDKPLTPNAVEKIFAQVAKATPQNPEQHEGPENVLLQEITPPDFVEIMIRLADAKFTSKSLPERVDQFLQVLHKAASTTTTTIMQDLLYTEGAQRVLDRYMVDVVRVFLFYAKRMPRSQAYARLLSCVLHVDHLMTLLEDAGALPNDGVGAAQHPTTALPFMTVADVRNVIKAIAVHEDGSPTQEITFPQFLEVIGSLSVYRTPDPLVLMENKLEVFVTQLIARVRAKNKGSSLVVSDVRCVAV